VAAVVSFRVRTWVTGCGNLIISSCPTGIRTGMGFSLRTASLAATDTARERLKAAGIRQHSGEKIKLASLRLL